LTAKKQFDRAAQEYARLLNDSPSFDNLHYAYGLSLAASSNIPAAVEQFKAEIALHPDNVAPRLEIAADLYKKDSATALPYAQEAVRLSPQLPFAHYLLGLLLLDTNAYQKAIPELEVAAKAFPRETKIFFALGTAYARAGRTEDAANARSTFARLSKEAQPEISSY
jgi:tetratricopeptide (TPR) repeat protein